MAYRFETQDFDLITPDGEILSITHNSSTHAQAHVFIKNISPWFVGFDIDKTLLFFNGKSTFAQLGLDIAHTQIELNKSAGTAHVFVDIHAYGSIAEIVLAHLTQGAYIGKLFAKDDRRTVRATEYLTRMFGHADRNGNPLLFLGAMHGSDELVLDIVDGRAIAYVALLNGIVEYDSSIESLLPTLASITDPQTSLRHLLAHHQQWSTDRSRKVQEQKILLVKTPPLHIRTVFAHVVHELLPPGYTHTSASILQPSTCGSGNIYEFFGTSKTDISDIPLEFYTLEHYRSHIFFADRTDLKRRLEQPEALMNAFATIEKPQLQSATFVVTGHQLDTLTQDDWISKEPIFNELPGIFHGARQASLLDKFIQNQSSYPFLKAIEQSAISSQGILLSTHLPSPLMKRMLLSEKVAHCLKAIYFQTPSFSHGDFFSHEDRGLLNDLYTLGIPVYWVDRLTNQILQYVQKPHRASGLFVPIAQVQTYLQATVFGVYGSNLITGAFEKELAKLLAGIMEMKQSLQHPLLSPNTPLALVTGGGPGAMELANKIALDLGILSCGNIADFRLQSESVVHEQKQNPYVQAKMTYRLTELVERQAEFNLDFPIFVSGGIGTDFEFCLEEVRRKVGSILSTPVLLFGDIEYWKAKISSRYQCNLQTQTIQGSEWISGNFFCIQTAEQGLAIYRKFFNHTLPHGKAAPAQPLGFVTDLAAF